MNTLNATDQEIAQAIEAFDVRTHAALRVVPLSLLLTLFNPIVIMALSPADADSEDWADTLRALCLDIKGLSKDKFDDLRKKLMIVVGIEIDRRFPVPA